jgi:hypothetical protein
MSHSETFMQQLRDLMAHVPDDLALNQLEWALNETSLTLGARIASIEANHQLRKPIPPPIDAHTEGTGPRLVVWGKCC